MNRRLCRTAAAVPVAVIVPVWLAVGLWLRDRCWLAVVSVGCAVVVAVFGIAWTRYQLDESRTGPAVLVAVVVAAYLAAATIAGLSTRAGAP